ncbi:MAG TPA: hypothetical protein VNH13_05435, partial [Candidatus Acidoferrales bacterium]|nr:hypothetical protein [Candidatus Acidoferrales bacterium]
LDGIAFGWQELSGLVHEGDRIDVVARLASRRFGGFESLQLEIRDAAPAGWHAERDRLAGTRPLVAVGPGSAAEPALAPATAPIPTAPTALT